MTGHSDLVIFGGGDMVMGLVEVMLENTCTWGSHGGYLMRGNIWELTTEHREMHECKTHKLWIKNTKHA